MLTPVLLVGLASGVVSLAIARGAVFAGLRARLTGLPGELIRCPLCLGAWLCAALTALQGAPAGLSPVVAWGSAWAVSTLYAVAVDRLAGDGE